MQNPSEKGINDDTDELYDQDDTNIDEPPLEEHFQLVRTVRLPDPVKIHGKPVEKLFTKKTPKKQKKSALKTKQTPPKLGSERNVMPDPVKDQEKAIDKFLTKQSPVKGIPEKQSIISAKITPSVGTRIDLQYVPQSAYEPGTPRIPYLVPKTKKQLKTMEKNRPYTYKTFCKYETVKIAEPIMSKQVNAQFEIPSPEPSSAKVSPRKVSPTSSWLHPDPQSSADLKLKKPKSGIFINETEPSKPITDYDSFDLVFSRQPRPTKRRGGKRKQRSGLAVIDEEGEEGARKRGRKEKKRSKDRKSSSTAKEMLPEEEYLANMEKEMEEMGYGDEEGDMSSLGYLTKQFRKKVLLMSRSTSYQIGDFESEEREVASMPALDKYSQKFRRDSEIKRYEPKRRKFRRGTLESHSFTHIHQPILKDFYFGSKQGTMHQGAEHLPETARNMQGIAIPATAYCYSFLKHPNRWTAENIDEILDIGSKLYLSSLDILHVHRKGKELRPEDLDKYCVIGQKKIRFSVEDPEVSGLIKSSDKTVFNLTKALNIFFARQKAGIFQTQDTNLAIWKDKYFYFFDGKPRTKDLYYSPSGTAVMANFYDIPAIVTVLLQRSGMQNWPFVIYPVKTYKVLKKDDPDEEEKTLGLDARSNYNILNENKAVLLGSYDLGDKCFDFTRNKQSLPMAVVCLVYSRITPPSAWHKTTIDKIMIIGNQLYIECMQCDAIDELSLNTIPAFFTIGPYIVEIYIYANRIVDIMYEKCNCQLKCCLEKFFETNTNSIVQIKKSYLAIWTQRNMYFCFDPYPRGLEGYKCRDGYGCVSMHKTLESLVDVVTHNFDDKDNVFNIHALKICKIHRDPVQSARFPKHIPLEEFPPGEFKTYKMRKSKKTATEKPITVDYTALAMRNLLMGQSPEPSIFEIGSNVGSLAMEQIPPLLHADRQPPKSALTKLKPVNTEVIADLDSPSLSDTQIAPPRPTQPKEDESVSFMDLDSFELTQEEIELADIEPEGEAMGVDDEMFDMEEAELKELEKEMAEEALGEDEDFYYTADEYAQVRAESLLPQVVSEEINTDLTFFPIKREILYPTNIRGKQEMRARLNRSKKLRSDWGDFGHPAVPDVTKSEELRKDTNFIDLPDDTQIIRGTKNITAFGDDVEFIAPFICIMADVVAKKYSVLTWTPEIVDYILKCGTELYQASKFRYDQVSKLEIPQISLGKTKFRCLVEYVFDSYTRQNILDLAIGKILFVRADMGILVTPTYACALIFKNHLYYMYDGFGNNEVGLSEGISDEGTACFSRFKDIHSLTTRIMYNKRKRESNEDVVYTRFVLSTVRVKLLHPSEIEMKSKSKVKDKDTEEEMAGQVGEGEGMDFEETSTEDPRTRYGTSDTRKEPELKIGYRFKNGFYVIQGTRALVPGDEGEEDEQKQKEKRAGAVELQEDHFACICACLMLLSCPVEKWDTKKVDEVLDHGSHVYSHADDLEMSEKRTIKNILIGKNFFDIIVKKVKIENWKDNKNLNKGIETLLRKRMAYFLIQFPDRCFALHKSTPDDTFHIFYPRGLPQKKKRKNRYDDEEEDEGNYGGGKPGGWLRCKDVNCAKRRLKRAVKSGAEAYEFYTFEVTSIRKAPKNMLINYKLNQYDVDKPKKSEMFGKPFYEDVEWLKTDILPWSRVVAENPEGKHRGTIGNLWHNWDIEYSKDLYSLLGNIHQNSPRFPEESRGKQTLCNLVTFIGMLEIYDLTEWNSAVVDSVLVNGDQYFRECTQDVQDQDYELSIDDLKESCGIFPFTFKVAFKPIVEGTMFLVRNTQFNLYKAFRYFFDNCDRRSGIICCTKSDTNKKQIAFGKAHSHEYYMFEVDARGQPMFIEGHEKAYVLRAVSLNRLLHVVTLTLRGGDFFVYEVEVTDLKPIP